MHLYGSVRFERGFDVWLRRLYKLLRMASEGGLPRRTPASTQAQAFQKQTYESNGFLRSDHRAANDVDMRARQRRGGIFPCMLLSGRRLTMNTRPEARPTPISGLAVVCPPRRQDYGCTPKRPGAT